MTIAEKATAGIKWSSASQFVRQMMQLVATAVLARLLSPADFGLVGMATIISGFAGLFHDLGTSAAVIQRRNISDELLSSIFWANIAFGVTITFLLIAIAPIAAVFYHEPRVTPVLRVLSLTFCISGLSILQQAILERDMAFNILARIEITATFLSAAIGIASAIMGAGVWSLVYQALTMVSVTSVLLWIASSWKPKKIFHWKEIKSVSNFSMNLTGFSIFNYFIRNADNLLIGRFLGAQNLGYYSLAYNLMLYPLQSVSSVIGRVMFPAFSKIQEDDVRFRYTFLKVTGAIALVTFPMMFGLWGVAEPFVMSVFGPQWKESIVLLLIFVPIGMVQSIGTTVGAIYLAKGRTDWLLRWGVLAGIIILASFLIGLRWGTVGVAAAYAVASLMLAYPSFAIPFKLISLPFRDLLKTLWRPFICGLLMLLVLILIKFILPLSTNSISQLSTLVSLGVFIYLLTSWLVNRTQMREILSLIGIRS